MTKPYVNRLEAKRYEVRLTREQMDQVINVIEDSEAYNEECERSQDDLLAKLINYLSRKSRIALLDEENADATPGNNK